MDNEREKDPNIDGSHRLRQDFHHGQAYRKSPETYAGHIPQQDAGRTAQRRIQGVLSGECCGVFRQIVDGG